MFDDIKDCDVNVTYDLIDGEFPPPNISGLVVRDPNDLLTSDDLPRARSDDLEGLCFGGAASDEADRRLDILSFFCIFDFLFKGAAGMGSAEPINFWRKVLEPINFFLKIVSNSTI